MAVDTLSDTPSRYRVVIEKMFQIVDKDGQRADFTLNPVQARLDAGWTRRNIIPKARQEGVSSYVLARFTAKCLGEQNRTCVVISHETEATRRLLGRVDFILKNLKLPAGMAPKFGRHSQNEIRFEKTNSVFYIGTAGQRAFGHGDTITDLHLSEVSRYPDPENIVRGTFPAAERGEITVESTGNGVGNWFHRQCVRAREGNGFRLHFFSWLDDTDYALALDDAARARLLATLDPDLEEPQLLARGVTPSQLAWRRERLNIDYERDLRAFKEAYPTDFDECFQSRDYSFFNRVRYEQVDAWTRESHSLHVLSTHPRPGLVYCVGADPAGGVGQDNSVAEVFCLDTREQVAEYASAHVEPHEFGTVIAGLARRFNNAYVNVERNNHGLTTLARLLEEYPLHLIHRATHGEQSVQLILSRLSHFGTLVSPANRGLVLGTARRLLGDEFTVHSPLLRSELSTFVEKSDGKIEADSGCHDDRVMASVHALIVVERAGIVATGGGMEPAATTSVDPFSWDALFSTQHTDTSESYGTPLRFH